MEGQSWGWLSPATLAVFIAALIGLILFYMVENKVKSPIIEFHLLANRIFLIGLTANFALAMFYAIDFFLIPLYLHYVRGQPSFQIGLTLLPATIMVALLSSFAGKMIDRHGPKGILSIGLLFFVISALLQSLFNSQTSIYFILFAYVLFGIGWACILSPSIVAALSAVPKESAGVGMGTLGTLHNLGGAMGLAVGTLLFNTIAKSSLISQLKQKDIAVDHWIDQVLANTDNAIQTIQENTHLALQNITPIFERYFLSGYRAAMFLLVASSIIALIAVWMGLKNKVH